LYWLVLRPLLETPLRLVACFLVGAALVTIPDLLLKRFVDADLPRTATAALTVILAGACLFLRASWRRRGPVRRRPRRERRTGRSATRRETSRAEGPYDESC
jgi:hypothetical protein